MGPTLSDDRRRLATGVVARRALLCVSAGDSSRDLHHERARERARTAPQDHQNPRPFSERRGGDETDLAGLAEYHRDVGTRGAVVADGDEPIRDLIWRSIHTTDDHVKWRR